MSHNMTVKQYKKLEDLLGRASDAEGETLLAIASELYTELTGKPLVNGALEIAKYRALNQQFYDEKRAAEAKVNEYEATQKRIAELKALALYWERVQPNFAKLDNDFRLFRERLQKLKVMSKRITREIAKIQEIK